MAGAWYAFSARPGTCAMAACASKRALPMLVGHWATVGYAGQIDAFAVYCPQVERVYLVPIAAVQTTIGARLRLAPTKNGQTWNIRWARDFELLPRYAA